MCGRRSKTMENCKLNPDITKYKEFIKFLGREKIKEIVDVSSNRKSVVTVDGYRYTFYEGVLVPTHRTRLNLVRKLLGEEKNG